MEVASTAINAAVAAMGLTLAWLARGQFQALRRELQALHRRMDALEHRMDRLEASLDSLRSDLIQVALAVGARPRAENT